MFSLAQITSALLIAMVSFSIYSMVTTLSEDSLNQMFMNTNSTMIQDAKDVAFSTGKKVGFFGLFAQTLNNLVPTIRYDIPGIDDYIIGINDIPYFDATDLFIMVPVLWFPLWWFKRRFHQVKGFKQFEIIVWVILTVLVAFLLSKVIEYFLYLWSAHNIGLTTTEALAIREAFIENTDESKLFLAVFSILGGVAILSSLINKKKK